MTALKCKMCGGDLELTPDVTVAECPYCGTKQTVPNADNEKKMTLFSRANRLRFNCEFDKAVGVYETIVAEFPEEAESYWGLVLCKYGIEYVDDPATGKKIPTCHRSSFDSVMEDENFELATEYADAVARRVYWDEAKQIEEIRKGIIEVSSKEEPYDVFICYKETGENGERTLDSVLAQDIYDALTEKDYRVFFSRITLEDKLGQEYEPYIFAALHSARVMLAVGTSYEHYDAVWVKNEWSRYLQLMAGGEKKTLIPCYKNLDAYDMPKEFAKLQAQDMGKVGALQDLLRGVDKIIGKGAEKATAADSAAASGMAVLNAQTASLLKRGYMALEDEDFEKAGEFFEQVLNNDAECSQAYLGQVFVSCETKNINSFIDTLFDIIERDEDGEELYLPEVDLVELAREADVKAGILSCFTDEELSRLMETEISLEAIGDRDCHSYYEEQLAEYGNPAALEKLIDNRDFERAEKYADEEIREKIDSIWEGLTEKIKTKIQEEKQKPEKYKLKQERRKERIRCTVTGWLEKAETVCEQWKKDAEEKAEAAYQASVAAQKSAYQEKLKNWEQEKKNYDENYNNAVARQSDLQGKIAQLEQEKAQLKGFFVGKKRRELEENIAVLQNNLSTLIVPKHPGERPVQENLPVRESFSTDLSTDLSADSKMEKLRVEASVFPSVRARVEQIAYIKTVSVGDKVYFGQYPYTASGDVRNIQWRVLDKKNGSVLLLAKKGIDSKPYNKQSTNITWENCTLRKWLNGEFINTAFTDMERILIQETKIDNGKSQGYSGYNTDGGNDTQDKVFLLSYKEAFEDYFTDDLKRICHATEYAKRQGAYRDSKTCGGIWWLRSPGGYPRSASDVDRDGSRDCNSVRFDSGCVRPALWINLESDIF